MNSCVLVGRITKDPERRVAQNGTTCTMFQLAVDRGAKGKNGEKLVDFIPCSAWAIGAEYICKYVKKGDMLALQGKIQTRSSVDQQGQSRFIVELVVAQVNILNPKPVERPKVEEPEKPKYDLDDEDHAGLPF